MTDTPSWQPPAGPAPVPDAAASPFGAPTPPPPPVAPPPPAGTQPPPPAAFPPPNPYGAPQYPTSPYGAPSPYGTPGAQQYVPMPGMPGWTPPPKPGLIPLRPLTLGTLLGASFQVLRRNPRPTFGFALLVTGLTSIVAIIAVAGAVLFSVGRATSATSEDIDTISAGATVTILIAALIPGALGLVVNAVLQGIISLEVARGTLGEKLRLGGLWRTARGRIGALIGWTFLLVLAAGVVILVVVAIIAGAVSTGSAARIAVSVLVGFLAFFGGIVVSAWLGTKFALVPSILMIERLRLRDAIARSWSLTRGFFWRTFGIILLVAVILYFVSYVISFPVSLVASFATSLFNPNSEDTGLVVGSIIVSVVTLLVTFVFGAIAAVIQASTTALIYIDLRMRKEGLDLELTRFVEARQAGDTSVDNPYLVGPAVQTVAPGPSTSPWA